MTGALWILAALVVAGILLYIGERRHRARNSGQMPAAENVSADAASESSSGTVGADESGNTDDSGECCGLHLVCEKDSLSPMSDEIVYYDDEELDRFIGRAPESYSNEEIEEFRDVLMTLRPADVAGWARSITQRRLELPGDVRDELLILVNEQRDRRGK